MLNGENMEGKVDYHIHTIYSDGRETPVEIVKKYKAEDYDQIAITDHDTVAGVREAQIAGEAVGLTVISGIEIAANMEDGAEVHVLGYNIDTESESIVEVCKKLQKRRNERNSALCEKLQKLGYEISKNELNKRNSTYLGRPDFAEFLREKYELEDPWTLLEDGRLQHIDVTEVIESIKNAGGISVLAHPMKIKFRNEEEKFLNIERLITLLKKKGLGGLECYHPSANPKESLELVKIASKHHLHITKGSDRHGSVKNL